MAGSFFTSTTSLFWQGNHPFAINGGFSVAANLPWPYPRPEQIPLLPHTEIVPMSTVCALDPPAPPRLAS
jgi:hypothetical protein